MSNFCPPSLKDMFCPPEGMTGVFGWVIGYSADEAFMKSAVESFSQKNEYQLGLEGRTYLALLLDRHISRITVNGGQSVWHISLSNCKKHFRLMHAKVALLLYKDIETEEYLLRLVVSTGNWTRETLEQSLDLFWTLDLPYEKINKFDQERCDCLAAWEFIEYLLQFCENPFMSMKENSIQTFEAYETFNRCIKKIKVVPKNSKIKPRFIDNRNKPFIAQLSDQIEYINNRFKIKGGNYLGMGSGFFEDGASKDKLPEVLEKISYVLKKKKLMEENAEIDIFVRPDACQGIQVAFPAIKQAGWSVRSAVTPQTIFGESTRDLHAKFVFGAHAGRTKFTDMWCYLGSGNLSHNGFMNKSRKGNLEVGVIFAVESMYWNVEAAKGDLAKCICNFLPVSWEGNEIKTGENINSGKNFEFPLGEYFEPPVSYFTIKESEQDGRLKLVPSKQTDCNPTYSVHSLSGEICSWKDGFVLKSKNIPKQVQVLWKDDSTERNALVPVIDKYGRISATDLSKELPLYGAWSLLDDFPNIDLDSEITHDPKPRPKTPTNPNLNTETKNNRPLDLHESKYTLRKVMEIIERIAEKQTTLREAEWTLWLQRLEMFFESTSDSDEAVQFRKWKINPLAPLKQICFIPTFAEADNFLLPYRKVIENAEKLWKVDSPDFIHLGSLE